MALAELYYVSDERLFAEPPELPHDYASVRAAVAQTALQLRTVHEKTLGFNVRDSYQAAYAIVGEEVAEASVRNRLYSFYFGSQDNQHLFPGKGVRLTNATTRAYVKLPPIETVQKSAVFQEPMATYLARHAVRGYIDNLTDALEPHAEENAGALFRAFTGKKHRNFSLDEADLAVVTLLPLVPADVRLTLKAGFDEYAQPNQ